MSKKSKRTLIIILVIIIVSASFMAAKFGVVSANSPEESSGLYKANPEKNQSPMAETGSITTALIKLLGALIVVVAGIYGFLLLLRKMMGRKFSGNRNNNLLEVIETTYVAQKKTVSLVRFADRAVLIGIGENNISVLAEMDEEETANILANAFVERDTAAGFKNFLSEARTKIMGLNMKGARVLHRSKNANNPQAA
jgi:flagellar biosynthetic protein FliO